ncbi:uncharacterized protein LOC127243629 [Andrographis paniculata]|uniref:uncharacterized protein LOC127243629 n=1 Tax=Andrographis paniculata TaxID=175694 RepID=UPI0021E8BB48|nr:uncharacterized protein LOC127243629 [Andrographis paniculata]
MAGISNRLLQLRIDLHLYTRRHRSYTLRHFSSSPNSSDTPQPDSGPGRESESTRARPSSFSDYFNEVKASLRKESPTQNREQSQRRPFSFPDRTPSQTPPSKTASLEEIRRNLSEFRLRAAPPSPSPPSSSDGQVSLQELYNRNVNSQPRLGPSPSSYTNPSSAAGVDSPPSLDSIRETLRRLKSNAPPERSQTDSTGKPGERLSFTNFKEHLKMKPDANANTGLGPLANFPSTFFSKEGSVGWGPAYGYKDLGEKLKSLRPEKRKGKWFSLQELNDRLAKLREIENKKSEEGLGVAVKDIRDSLKKMSKSKDEKARQGTIQRLGILGAGLGTPSFMLYPPKEELVEKFFHPDNMSSAEKLKLELQKVRDEFKMSESDCGSARVQVAQLTTKIKHLSTVLAKKDKHSRKGLLGMVQRRKKLLKYLRRTDWDSYCLVLSKLGLRDNPDIKA